LPGLVTSAFTLPDSLWPDLSGFSARDLVTRLRLRFYTLG